MFMHDPRSAKVSKGFESPNLQGRVNSLGLERDLGLQEPVDYDANPRIHLQELVWVLLVVVVRVFNSRPGIHLQELVWVLLVVVVRFQSRVAAGLFGKWLPPRNVP
ncbi:hypothetical protein Tco_1136094 [Tanacetum coccineum]